MPGRPRKPTALRVLQGNAGKRPLPKGEPQPELGCEPPPWLPDDARSQWSRLAPTLLELGLLTEVDGDAFGALCILTAQLASLAKIPGTQVQDITKELRQLWGRFGMTPADRAKVSVAPKEQKSKLSRYAGGTKQA